MRASYLLAVLILEQTKIVASVASATLKPPTDTVELIGREWFEKF